MPPLRLQHRGAGFHWGGVASPSGSAPATSGFYGGLLTVVWPRVTVCGVSAASLERKIATSVVELGNLLSAIKGGGQLNQPTNRNIVAAEADEVSGRPARLKISTLR